MHPTCICATKHAEHMPEYCFLHDTYSTLCVKDCSHEELVQFSHELEAYLFKC